MNEPFKFLLRLYWRPSIHVKNHSGYFYNYETKLKLTSFKSMKDLLDSYWYKDAKGAS